MNLVKKCSARIVKNLTSKAATSQGKKIFFNASWRGSYMAAANKSFEQPKAINSECKLCAKFTAENDQDNYVLERKKFNYLALARYPYHEKAHLLGMPYKHCGSLSLLTDDERVEMIDMIAHADGVFKKHKLNTFMGFNIGRNAGAGISGHLHGHVIAYREKQDTILHFKDKPADLTVMYAQVKK